MATQTNEFIPDYAVPPGWVLKDYLDSMDISQAEFARRCGRSAKLISEIMAGNAPIDPKTAIQFERVLNLDSSIWLGIEADYRLHLAREAEAQKSIEYVEWAKTFPVQELVKRKSITKPTSSTDTVAKLLSFFGVASVSAWQAKYACANVAYRHSHSFDSNERALATWLRLGEIESDGVECADYNKARFNQALREIRQLTQTPPTESLEQANRLCKESGVILAFVRPLPKTALSGATWWSTPRKAVIQLSARHKRDDHLWFSLFHEAAHILLHSKKFVFIETDKKKMTDLDAEADRWAANFLIPYRAWQRFIGSRGFSEYDVCKFAEEQGIAPSIVVGRLQHEGLLHRSRLNELKTSLRWVEDTD